MAKVDPEQLQAEAKELLEQMTNANAEPEASDTEQELAQLIQETPEEPEESVEVQAEEVSEEEKR